jgi:hypothetical protein
MNLRSALDLGCSRKFHISDQVTLQEGEPALAEGVKECKERVGEIEGLQTADGLSPAGLESCLQYALDSSSVLACPAWILITCRSKRLLNSSPSIAFLANRAHVLDVSDPL